ncbi:MAG: prenyltransferase/squalene oxidase repeat-containing protein [Acidobacteriota bacterium]
MSRLIVLATVTVLLLAPAPEARQAPAPDTDRGGLSSATRAAVEQAMRRGSAYIKAQQKADGTFDPHPGITAMATSALLLEPGVAPAARVKGVSPALDYLRGLAKPDGGLYTSAKMIPHYITAVSSMALVAGGRSGDREVIEKARAYLAEHLLDEGEGIDRANKFYGGMGYGGTSDGGIADIISLEFGLRAMKEAGLPEDNPAWEKAIAFLQRTQNFAETNDQEWAASDGGFVYYPGYSQVEGTTRSYGSASYAGILSFSWANLKPNDRRVQSVMKWVRDNYTVEENPGIGTKALYYYYMVFGKALRAVGEPVIVDAKGERHNWREDLARKLLSLQNADGSWVNANPAEMQNNRVLVTSFTLMALDAVLN